MAYGHLPQEALITLREHGHPDAWEVAWYGDPTNPDSVTVECTRCGEVLVELVTDSARRDPEADAKREALWKRFEARFDPADIDDQVHALVSQDASAINNAGLEDQFDYLYRNAGAAWLEQLLDTEDAVFGNDDDTP